MSALECTASASVLHFCIVNREEVHFCIAFLHCYREEVHFCIVLHSALDCTANASVLLFGMGLYCKCECTAFGMGLYYKYREGVHFCIGYREKVRYYCEKQQR